MTIRDELLEMPSGAMIRAARGLIGLETTQLAEAVGVTRKTIFAIERDLLQPLDERRRRTLRKIRDYFVEARGVIFIFAEDGLGEGVRLAKPTSDSADHQ